jgi:serine/threonine protein kinase
MSRLMDATNSHVSTGSIGTVNCMPPELLCGQGVHNDLLLLLMLMLVVLSTVHFARRSRREHRFTQLCGLTAGAPDDVAHPHALTLPSACAGLSRAADVYSFGIIMYEIYAGQMAFQGANLGHLIFQIGKFAAGRQKYFLAYQPHRAISCKMKLMPCVLCANAVHRKERPAVPKGCPQAYADLMCACWQHEPADRWAEHWLAGHADGESAAVCMTCLPDAVQCHSCGLLPLLSWSFRRFRFHLKRCIFDCRPKFAEVLARIQQQYSQHRANLQPVAVTTRSRSRPNVSYTFDTLEIAEPVPDAGAELLQQPLPDDNP